MHHFLGSVKFFECSIFVCTLISLKWYILNTGNIVVVILDVDLEDMLNYKAS